MKRFIIISALVSFTTQIFACGWIGTHNYYLFSVYDSREFSRRVDEISMNNWKAYLGSDEEFSFFDADVIIQSARKKGDVLMESYVRNLQKYLECAQKAKNESWDYPTKAELSHRQQVLQSVRAYAKGKLKTRLRSQYALLLMRCNMMLGRHAENISFWEKTASQYIETIYKDMMKNIYAGALLKTGHPDRSGALFAEMGDWESLMTQYYEKRSYQAIRAEYLRDANSPVLPFLLQDFVNNAQEAIDGTVEGNNEGKLFVRDIQKSEALQMCQLATLVVKEGKNRHPLMWQSAKAWLEYLFGNKRQAQNDIKAFAKLEGTQRMRDNARVLTFYISSAESPVSKTYNDYLAGELSWLETMQKTDDHYGNALDRTIHQVLADKYLQANRPEVAIALYNMDHANEYDCFLDTMAVEHLLQYLKYAKSPSTTALDRYIKSHIEIDPHAMNDLIGTKYLRLCQWGEALTWLAKVPLSFVNEKYYHPYALYRQWTVEPWLTRQWLTWEQRYGEHLPKLKSNPKVAFAHEMLDMENKMTLLTGQNRQQCCYDLAVRYAQACFTGDCWFLMHDGKSVSDTVRVNEVDLAAKAVSLLREASKSSDLRLRERSLFALSYVYLYPESHRWSILVWDNSAIDYVRKVNPQSQQYQAFTALAEFEKQNTQGISEYVSRCDEYKQFCKRKQ